MKRAKQKKNRWAIKSGNGHKNPWD